MVYQQPAALFVQSAQYHAHHAAEYDGQSTAHSAAGTSAGTGRSAGAGDAGEDGQLVDQSTNLLDSEQQQEANLLDLDDVGSSSSAAASAGGAAASAGGSAGGAAALLDDLAGLDSLLTASTGSNGGVGLQQPQQLQLNAGFKLMPGVFQEKWKALGPAEQYVESLNMATVAALAQNSHKDFCAHVGQANVLTMACGGAPPMYK